MSTLNDELSEMLETDVDEQLTKVEDNAEELILFMSRRIEELLSGSPDTLMSMMYRLDINEGKIKMALSPTNPENPAIGLARLIVDRQRQRMETKKKYKQPPLEDWADF